MKSKQSINLNLLIVFDALMRHRNVTKAAAEVGVSQSGVSHALRQLRHYYRDHLLLRRQGVMEPTPRALALAGPVSSALATLNSVLDAEFDPVTYEREFNIGIVDVHPSNLITATLTTLATKSPHISMRFLPLSATAAEGQLLSSDIDLIIGNFRTTRKHVVRDLLLSERMVVIARKGHPQLQGSLSPKQYGRLEHVRVPYLDDWLDLQLPKKHRTRMFSIVASHIAEVPLLTARSSAIATLPMSLAMNVAALVPLRIYTFPFKLPPLEIVMAWHAHSRPDASHRWMRSVFAQAASSLNLKPMRTVTTERPGT